MRFSRLSLFIFRQESGFYSNAPLALRTRRRFAVAAIRRSLLFRNCRHSLFFAVFADLVVVANSTCHFRPLFAIPAINYEAVARNLIPATCGLSACANSRKKCRHPNCKIKRLKNFVIDNQIAIILNTGYPLSRAWRKARSIV
jgi:hypothetical protein